jgi:hypothetical protein
LTLGCALYSADPSASAIPEPRCILAWRHGLKVNMDNELLQKQALVVRIFSVGEKVRQPGKKFLYGKAFCDM